MSPTSVDANLIDPVQLECSVTVPSSLSGMISNITWMFGTKVINTGVSTMLNQGVSNLDLGNVKTVQAGQYTCEARVVSQFVDVDEDVSSSVVVNVTVTRKRNYFFHTLLL